MAWNWMTAEVVAADAMVRPTIGPGGMARDQAHAEVQAMLGWAAAEQPALERIAAAWRRGARDDTVYVGGLAWTIYQYPDDGDPRRAALAWLDDYAATLRGAGLHVTVARLPD